MFYRKKALLKLEKTNINCGVLQLRSCLMAELTRLVPSVHRKVRCYDNCL